MSKLPAWGVGAVAILVVLGLATMAYLPAGSKLLSSSAQSSSATTSATTSTFTRADGAKAVVSARSPGSASGNWLTDDPAFAGSHSTLDYPPAYSALANYTLSLINADRASSGLPGVELSSVPSGQQHADSMAFYRYFSHWDNQGYKPYMRYTLLGGNGSMTENLALDGCSASPPGSSGAIPASCTVQTVENAVRAAEWGMMNNDTNCCGNSHRANILEPIHNRVSIGIAYNSTTVYLVEDFEDTYIGSESFQVSSGVVDFRGLLPQEPWPWMNRTAGAEIGVFFDPTPASIPASSLAASHSCSRNNELNESTDCQYEGAYNPGAEISTVLTPCTGNQCVAGNYTYAQTWQYSSGRFEIVFSIGQLISQYGSGVYTFYLWPAERAPEAITSLSVFVASG